MDESEAGDLCEGKFTRTDIVSFGGLGLWQGIMKEVRVLRRKERYKRNMNTNT